MTYDLPSHAVALHFSRLTIKGSAQQKPKNKFDASKLLDHLAQAEQEERESLDHELLGSATKPR